MNRLFVAAATAMVCAGSASAGVHFTITPTGDSTATISGSGTLDGDLFDVIIIRFVNPNPLILADDGDGDTITGNLALGSTALDTAALSTQGLGQLQFRYDAQPVNFSAGDAATGSGDMSFNIELIAPEGTEGVVEVLFAGVPTPPPTGFRGGSGGFSAVIGTYSIVPAPASAALLGLGVVATTRRRR